MDDPFIAFVLEQLGGLERLGCRAMFGGHGLYRGPTLFGIVFAGRAYFKTGGATATECLRRDTKPFRPDHEVLRTYIEVPGDVLADRDRLREWARAAAWYARPDSCRHGRPRTGGGRIVLPPTPPAEALVWPSQA